ncbi:MAG TPA: ROK family protein [Erysipelotrichaceae bacterium]|nr:ROK family protein [Erysipelotrichaceae bacterium]
MKTVIGIDLGGTNVRVAKVSEDGQILQVVTGPSYALEGTDKVMTNLKSLIRQIDGFNEVVGIGIGVPGPVDTVKGVMTMATNLPGFENYPMAQEIEREFNLPTYVDNDANVAGLAEALVGAGKGYKIVYYITHSTGVGGALVADGKVISGKNGYAGEVGNIIVTSVGEKINHLNVGAAENVFSGTALVKEAKEKLNPNITSAKAIFDLAKEGNVVAQKMIDEMAYHFAVLCSAIGHVVDPHVFVIGGGVSKSHEAYFDKILENYNKLVHVGMRNPLFKRAELSEPGIVGAAMLPISHGQ